MKKINLKSSLLSIAVPVTGVVLLSFLTMVVPSISSSHSKYLFGITGVVGALVVTAIAIRIDKLSFADYSLQVNRETVRNCFLGLLFSMGVGVLMIGSQVLFSDLKFNLMSDNLSGFSVLFFSLLPTAFYEELLFRSYGFIRLHRTFGLWTAQVVMAILFALYHVAGGGSIFEAFIGPGIWAFAFGLLAVRSNGISMPFGFHFGLNFLLAMIGDKDWIPPIFSVSFSGEATASAVRANELFGIATHIVLFITCLIFTGIQRHRNTGRLKREKK